MFKTLLKRPNDLSLCTAKQSAKYSLAGGKVVARPNKISIDSSWFTDLVYQFNYSSLLEIKDVTCRGLEVSSSVYLFKWR